MTREFDGRDDIFTIGQDRKEELCEKLGELIHSRTQLVDLDAEDLAWDVFAFFEEEL